MAKNPGSSHGPDKENGPRIAIIAALIGVAGAVLAAVIGALLASGGNKSSGVNQSSGDQPQATVQAVSFTQEFGTEIATVTGTVRHLGANEEVFAVARPTSAQVTQAMQPSAKTLRSWLVSFPAEISNNGRWVAEILGVSPSATLIYQAVVVPQAAEPCPTPTKLPRPTPTKLPRPTPTKLLPSVQELCLYGQHYQINLGNWRYLVKSRPFSAAPHH